MMVCNFRAENGTGVAMIKDDLKAMYQYHYGREPIVTLHSSNVVPRGSPLKVGRQ